VKTDLGVYQPARQHQSRRTVCRLHQQLGRQRAAGCLRAARPGAAGWRL